jgi:hypothetical protein
LGAFLIDGWVTGSSFLGHHRCVAHLCSQPLLNMAAKKMLTAKWGIWEPNEAD